MAITAAQVKELREMTGAGMMECKKALTECGADMEAAVEWLRKNGIMKAAKKASRIAAEGLCMIASDSDQEAAVVEVNSETDFVAQNEKFRTYVAKVADQALQSSAADIDAFLAEPWIEDASKSVNDVLVEMTAVISEKLSIRRFQKVTAENGCVVSYVHGGGRIGVIVEGICPAVNDAVKEALYNVAMQVAAMNPKYVSEDEIPAEEREHEKEILLAQALKENEELPEDRRKPQQIIEKMLAGRLVKQFKEICLNDQIYVKAEDGKQSVAQYLAQVAKANGTEIAVKRFVRFEVGEGIEKRADNFAEEVMAQVGKN